MKIKAKKTSLSGHIQVPGSKSHTIRALLLASLAEGTSRIANIAQIDRGYEDIEQRLNALGANITRQ